MTQADIGVFDALPVFRLGLLAALGQGGSDLGSPAATAQWLRGRQRGLLLLTLHTDEAWALLERVPKGTDVDVVGVLEPFGTVEAAQALRAGAANVIGRDAGPEQFRAVVTDTLGGVLTISQDVLRAATASTRQTRAGVAVTEEELIWLRSLAGGSSVAVLASASGYSERMMFRKLHALYERLGVGNRTQALLRAQDEGWV